MKKLLTIASLLSCMALLAQHKVAEKIIELQKTNAEFKTFSVLNVVHEVSNAEVNKVVDQATFATIKKQNINAIAFNNYETIEVEIPYQNDVISVLLFKVNPLAEGFHVDTDKGQYIPYQKGAYYRGIVKGDPKSLSSFNFFNGEFNGIISSNEIGNLVIGKLDKNNNTTDYIVYSDVNLKVLNQFDCHVKDNVSENHEHSSSRNVTSDRCVTTYFEIDYDLYLANNSSTGITSNWITSVFNNVQTLFGNDGISVALKSIYIWTSTDPYTGNTSYDYLAQFNSVRPVFDGDVGQLVGIDPGALGGVAVRINGLCSQHNYSYSDVNVTYSTVPTYSWTVQVISHELGHLLGSRHTHGCYWNGNNTAIDGCGQSAGFNEGSCAQGPIPSTTVKGTIMSYCHLVSGVGISFSNGFGLQPRTAILNAVNSSSCLSMDCINTCINMINSVSVININNNSATVNFNESGGANLWQKNVVPFGSQSASYTNTNSNSFNVNDLAPNTYYKAKVRPSCSENVTASSRETVFATTADYCNSILVTDTGGANGNYSDNESFVRVLMPNISNHKITLTFSSFRLETDYDYLHVYDGNSTSAPDVSNGGFTGTTIPEPITSTATDGSLTMRFYSDAYVVDTGWIATTTCSPLLGVNTSQYLDFTYYPNPAKGFVSISSKSDITEIMVYNVEGRLLYSNTMNDLNAKVDLSSFATGTYFFKVKFNEKEANFKILKI